MAQNPTCRRQELKNGRTWHWSTSDCDVAWSASAIFWSVPATFFCVPAIGGSGGMLEAIASYLSLPPPVLTRKMADHPFLRHLAPFLETVGKLKSVELLSGGMQNTNYKLTVELPKKTASSGLDDTPDTRQLVVRIPSEDASEHGQTHAIVFANSVQAAKCGGNTARYNIHLLCK